MEMWCGPPMDLYPGYRVQSVLVPKTGYTRAEAAAWLKYHGFKLRFGGKGPDATANFYRYRQRNPRGRVYFTHVLPSGIELVYMRADV